MRSCASAKKRANRKLATSKSIRGGTDFSYHNPILLIMVKNNDRLLDYSENLHGSKRQERTAGHFCPSLLSSLP